MKKKAVFGFVFLLGLFMISLLTAIDYLGESKAVVEVREGIFCPNEYNHTRWENTLTGNTYATYGAGIIYDCRDFWDTTNKNASCCPKIGSTITTCQDATGKGLDVRLLPGLADTGDRWACFILGYEPIGCSIYNTQEECEGYTADVAEYSVESNSKYGDGWCGPSNRYTWYENNDGWVATRDDATKICSNFTSCACVWNETAKGGAGGCVADASVYKECNDTDVKEISEFCQYFITIDDSECNELGGMITMSWEVVNPAMAAECELENEKIPCTDVVRLSFFTWKNALAVIILLIIIYYIYSIKKKSKSKKKTSKKRK